MKEKASRYATSAGSEEVELIPDKQENDENQNSNNDDDDYSPTPVCRTLKEIKKQVMTSQQPKSHIYISSPNMDEQGTRGLNNGRAQYELSFKSMRNKILFII